MLLDVSPSKETSKRAASGLEPPTCSLLVKCSSAEKRPRCLSLLLVSQHSVRRYPLEPHLTGTVVAQQGPKDQPAHASIGVVARNEDRRIYVISKYLSMYFLTRHYPLKVHVFRAAGQQSVE
jgi:hypothetical protein